jgi:hypothetical protein
LLELRLMRTNTSKQRGAGLLAILFGIAFLAVIASVTLKLAPHYMQFLTVKSVMNSVLEDPDVANLDRRGLLDQVDSRLYINDVRTVTRKDFQFARLKRADELSVDYEVREHLFGNLDALLSFSHKIQIDRK